MFIVILTNAKLKASVSLHCVLCMHSNILSTYYAIEEDQILSAYMLRFLENKVGQVYFK
jgi:hypothetical protein